MPADYPLEQLGPEDFQRLAQAVLLAEFPGLQCLPIAQPDGGRDAFATLLVGGRKEPIIFQVKFHRNPLAVTDARKWLRKILREEVPKVQELVAHAKAGQYRLITNVPGTSHLRVGSVDRTQSLLDDALPVPSQCLWRDDVNRRIDANPGIRWAYPQLLTGGDLLQALLESGAAEADRRRTLAVRAAMVRQYREDSDVRFSQIELEVRLTDMFIDVPTTCRWRDVIDASDHYPVYRELAHRFTDSGPATFVPHQNSHGYQIQDTPEEFTVGAASLLLDSSYQAMAPRVVMEGAPGQGKSTLVQYLCQVHRRRILDKSTAGYAREHQLRSARLPFKVDLRDFAQWLRRENPFQPGEPVPDLWQ